jgi:tetratricopeptide (TPR) repeat protein
MSSLFDFGSIEQALMRWISLDASVGQTVEERILGKALTACVLDSEKKHDALLELAKLLWSSGRPGGAARLLETVREARGAGQYSLIEAKAWMAAREYGKAAVCFGKIRESSSCKDVTESYLQALRKVGRGEESLRVVEEEIVRRGRTPWTIHALGLSLLKVGETREAVNHFREVGEISGWAGSSLSGYAFSLSYLGGDATGELREFYSRLRRAPASIGFAPIGLAPLSSFGSRRKRVRIAYVSGDFAQNPLSRFFLPVIREHRSDLFDVIGYSLRESPDAVTLEISQLCDQWHSVHGWTIDALCHHIRNQKVDVLVDLGGWSSGGHPRLFQNRCAPLQMTMLGMMQDTGLLEMDYRVSDQWLDPDDGIFERGFDVERLLRHPMAAITYEAPPQAGSTGRAGSQRMTFGVVAQLEKVSRRVAKVWAEVLRAVGDARLIVLGDTGHLLLSWLSDEGLDVSRVEVRGRQSGDAYFQALREMDVILDSFPFAGLTSTLDAAWMGVPTVTRKGSLALERGGFLVASKLSMPMLAASTDSEFVQIAVSLAAEVECLRMGRAALRERVRVAFCDARAWTRIFEQEVLSLLNLRAGVSVEKCALSSRNEPRIRLWETAVLRAGLSEDKVIATSVSLEAAGLSEQAGRLIEMFLKKSQSLSLIRRWCEWRLHQGGVDDLLLERMKRIEGHDRESTFLNAEASYRLFGGAAALRVLADRGHSLESYETKELLDAARWAWSARNKEIFSKCMLIAVDRGLNLEVLRSFMVYVNASGQAQSDIHVKLNQICEWLGVNVATPTANMADFEQNILQARNVAKNGELSEAARLLADVLEADPSHVGAKVALAEITGESGRPDLEIDILVDVLQENESCLPAFSALVRALVREGRLSDALEVSEGFVESNPECVEARGLMSSVKRS